MRNDYAGDWRVASRGMPLTALGSCNFDVIGQDRQVRFFHGNMLRDLLGMIGCGPALQDQAGGQENDTQVADAIAEAAYQHVFEPFLFGEQVCWE